MLEAFLSQQSKKLKEAVPLEMSLHKVLPHTPPRYPLLWAPTASPRPRTLDLVPSLSFGATPYRTPNPRNAVTLAEHLIQRLCVCARARACGACARKPCCCCVCDREVCMCVRERGWPLRKQTFSRTINRTRGPNVHARTHAHTHTQTGEPALARQFALATLRRAPSAHCVASARARAGSNSSETEYDKRKESLLNFAQLRALEP